MMKRMSRILALLGVLVAGNVGIRLLPPPRIDCHSGADGLCAPPHDRAELEREARLIAQRRAESQGATRIDGDDPPDADP
jgi:hypothetical protein